MAEAAEATITPPAEDGESLLLIAAAAATGAATNLIQIARDGDTEIGRALFGLEVVEHLADALQCALKLELESAEGERVEMLGQLAAACGRFIDGWA